MATLYLVGGSARAGKSTIASSLLTQHPMPSVSTDALRSGLRNALFAEPHVAVEELNFEGEVVFHRPGRLKPYRRGFTGKGPEEALVWKYVRGFIDHYDHPSNTRDLLIEGVALAPGRVHRLKPRCLQVRAVFVGFSKPAHAETLLEVARSNENDWLNRLIKEHRGEEDVVRKWAAKVAKECRRSRKQAQEYGYGFFDLSTRQFQQHVKEAVRYLLDDNSQIGLS